MNPHVNVIALFFGRHAEFFLNPSLPFSSQHPPSPPHLRPGSPVSSIGFKGSVPALRGESETVGTVIDGGVAEVVDLFARASAWFFAML
jgi:hypothetical protein